MPVYQLHGYNTSVRKHQGSNKRLFGYFMDTSGKVLDPSN